MARYLMVAMVNCVEGTDDEFNAWYDNVHLPDVLRNEGFVSGQRFRIAPVQRRKDSPPYRYLAIYEVETDDLARIQARMDEKMKDVVRSPALLRDRARMFSYFFVPMGDAVLASTLGSPPAT